MTSPHCEKCHLLENPHNALFTSFHWNAFFQRDTSCYGHIVFVFNRHETNLHLLAKMEIKDLMRIRQKVISVCKPIFSTKEFTFTFNKEGHLYFVLTPIGEKNVKEELENNDGEEYEKDIRNFDNLHEIRRKIVASLIAKKIIDKQNHEVIPSTERLQNIVDKITRILSCDAVDSFIGSITIRSSL